MYKACHQTRDYERSLIRNLSAGLLEDMRKRGMTVTSVSDAEIARMRERTKPVVERFSAEIGAGIVTQAQQEIAAVRRNGK